MLQLKTFGNARGHRAFPRARRSHNDRAENLVQRHLWLMVLSKRTLKKGAAAAGHSWQMRAADTDSTPLSFAFARSAQRSQGWAFLLQHVSTAAEALTRYFLIARRQEEEKVKAGTQEEEKRRGVPISHTVHPERNEVLSPCAPTNVCATHGCVYCIMRLCNWSVCGEKRACWQG